MLNFHLFCRVFCKNFMLYCEKCKKYCMVLSSCGEKNSMRICEQIEIVLCRLKNYFPVLNFKPSLFQPEEEETAEI